MRIKNSIRTTIIIYRKGFIKRYIDVHIQDVYTIQSVYIE